MSIFTHKKIYLKNNLDKFLKGNLYVEIFNKLMDKFPGQLLTKFPRDILKKFPEKLLWEFTVEIQVKSSVHLLLILLVGILVRISCQTSGFLVKLLDKFPVKLPN